VVPHAIYSTLLAGNVPIEETATDMSGVHMTAGDTVIAEHGSGIDKLGGQGETLSVDAE
jgi:hypothetical protein